ncbi:MAG: hypothetical protein IPG72_00895 [Ardenticatenales bacterium]|nr:hypothetical protein [Ardenticatenales bacterium]
MIARLDRSAGTAALAAAAGWLVILVGFLLQSADGLVPWDTLYALLAEGGLIVGLVTIVALNGMLARVGGARDPWRIVALVLAVLGVGVLTLLTWFTPLLGRPSLGRVADRRISIAGRDAGLQSRPLGIRGGMAVELRTLRSAGCDGVRPDRRVR